MHASSSWRWPGIIIATTAPMRNRAAPTPAHRSVDHARSIARRPVSRARIALCCCAGVVWCSLGHLMKSDEPWKAKGAPKFHSHDAVGACLRPEGVIMAALNDGMCGITLSRSLPDMAGSGRRALDVHCVSVLPYYTTAVVVVVCTVQAAVRLVAGPSPRCSRVMSPLGCGKRRLVVGLTAHILGALTAQVSTTRGLTMDSSAQPNQSSFSKGLNASGLNLPPSVGLPCDESPLRKRNKKRAFLYLASELD